MKIERKEVYVHIVAWIAWLTIQTLLIPFTGPTLLLYIVSPIQFYSAYIAVFYITALYILPYFWPNKIFHLISSFIILFCVFNAFRIFMLYYVLPSLGKNTMGLSYLEYTRISFFWFLQYVFFAVAYFAFKRKQQLEKAVLESEYSFLKAQFNPHFLFNTLSYLYTNTVFISENTAKAIMLLSEIMRYSLQEEKADHKVPLQAEIDHLKNYIELHRLRNDNEIYINLEIHGDTSDRNILPLLLISPVENAFKYGMISRASSPLCIVLNIEVNQLEFTVKNRRSIARKINSHGLGHKNLMRRLELAYKGKYCVDIQEEKEHYTFKLIINDLQ